MRDPHADQSSPPSVEHAAEAPRQRIEYPTHRVVAVVDGESNAAEVVRALTSKGFLDSEIVVATGPAQADAVHATTGRGRISGLAIRLASKLGVADEEMELKDAYEQALRDGRYVVTVDAPTRERKDRAAEILRAGGAYELNYFGRFTIESITAPRAD